jgi:glutamine amidotransferase
VTIALLDHGSGNLRSVAHALSRVGAEVEVTGDAARVLGADGLVVPGVGHFGACMNALRERSLDATIKDFIATGRPVFGVCVGMQVLFEGSDEAPDVAGLGIFDARVERLPDDVRVPHMGWNRVVWRREPLHAYVADIPDPWMYFAHSFAPWTTDAVGSTGYGSRLIAAAVARENVFATQFHPEKSGVWGLQLYEAFVRDVER